MWENLVYWVTVYWLQIILAITLGIVSYVVYRNRFLVSLWWTDTIAYGLLGKGRKLAKQHPSLIDGGWFHNEDRLCNDYNKHYGNFTKSVEDYDNAKMYLVNADEADRKPMPTWVAFMLFVIVIVEAFGFSYVFSGKAIPGGSERVQVYQGLGIAFLVSIGLLIVTHVAGVAYYRNSKIRKIRTHHNQAYSVEGSKPHLQQDKQIGLDNNKDDDKLSEHYHYLKILNRTSKVSANVVPNEKPYWAALSAVVLVMILAFAVRTAVYEETKTAETIASQNYYSDASSLPNEVVQPQKNADATGKDEMGSAGDAASILTFVFLSILFAIIQGVSVWMSSHWGFVGIASSKAYELVKDFPTRNEFLRYYDEKKNIIVRLAQNRLSALQQKMAQIDMDEGTDAAVKKQIKNRSGRTFLDFLKFHNEKAREQKTHVQENSHSGTSSHPSINGGVNKGDDLAITAEAAPSVINHENSLVNNEAVFDGYSDKQRKRFPKRITLAELELLADAGGIDDSCYVLKGKDWVRFGEVRVPSLPPDDLPPLPA